MGMDLVAHRQSSDPDAPENCFHANWTWWGVLTGLLARLDADLSDGDIETPTLGDSPAFVQVKAVARQLPVLPINAAVC
jgi:hypothetical protein